MITARKEDKQLVIDILAQSFESNQSVNYIVLQDSKRQQRIKHLMDYSFEICYTYGKVYLSDDRKACALVLFPDQKTFSIKSTLLDISLIINAIGLTRIGTALSRESAITSQYPKDPIYYLWFLGVLPSAQGEGTGSKLLSEIIADAGSQHKPIYLETSTVKNLPWYQKFGFKIYHELEFTYKLYMLRREDIPLYEGI